MSSLISFAHGFCIGNSAWLNLTMNNVNVEYVTVSGNILTFIKPCKIRIMYTRTSGAYANLAYVRILKNGVAIADSSANVDATVLILELNMIIGDTLNVQCVASGSSYGAISSACIITI